MKNDRYKPGNFLMDFIIGKKWRYVRHVVMLIFLAISFYPDIEPSMFESLNIENPTLIIQSINRLVLVLFLMSVLFIYINLLLLVPLLLLQNKYVYYFTACFCMTLVYFFCEYFTAKLFLKDFTRYLPGFGLSLKGFIHATLMPIIFLGATAGYKIFKKWIKDTQLLAEMKAAKVEDELLGLKNQINPHFLFNTLNNLNTLIATDAARASKVVLGLSDVLRYQLYETNANKVLLKKDMEILNELLQLEKIRRDDFQFSITSNGLLHGIMVPPFIFINFVENAIKHSADNKNFSYVTAEYRIENNRLAFTCKNSKPSIMLVKKQGGLGLQNIKRRLELLYGNSYELHIKDELKEFTIQLKIPL
jgi:Histidine kinase